MKKLTVILIHTAVILLVACSPESKSTPAPSPSEPPSKIELSQMPSCTIYNSRNWNVRLSESAEGGGYRLTVSGEVDLPTPGYTVGWSAGITDRMQPPGQNINLTTKPPKGMSLQVISPQQVELSMETPHTKFRHVAIYCGKKLLVSMPDVELSE